MKISIVVPAYEYNGFGKECLEYSFNQMKEQVFDDFNVIISDQSADYKIRDLCNSWRRRLPIKYIHNKDDLGNPAANLNNAIKSADGEWIKILGQDDYLAYSDSLLKISKALDDTSNWLATGYLHTHDRKHFLNYHNPQLNSKIYIINTIGNPSCTIFRNMNPIPEFDVNLLYCWDCEYYYRFMKQYGAPKFITDVTVVTYLWDKSISSKITQDTVDKENDYILKKHGIN